VPFRTERTPGARSPAEPDAAQRAARPLAYWRDNTCHREPARRPTDAGSRQTPGVTGICRDAGAIRPPPRRRSVRVVPRGERRSVAASPGSKHALASPCLRAVIHACRSASSGHAQIAPSVRMLRASTFHIIPRVSAMILSLRALGPARAGARSDGPAATVRPSEY
jgi:hypothetical protein